MQRHPVNRNLSVYSGETFHGFAIMADKGPFIYEYLETLKVTIGRALGQYPRVFAFRCDLRFPANALRSDKGDSNSVMSEFLASFKAQIESSRNVAARNNQHTHKSEVRYVWAREQGQGSNVHHYHLLILLNWDAFYTLGRFGSERVNMIHRLEQAWACALRLPLDCIQGLVHIPRDAKHHIRRYDPIGQERLFYRASYLCKEATKPFGNSCHVFGSSRN
ncbi:inovirus Gp2 family protein [Pseudomonas sp. GOM6]|uniref:inovirus Gp2 family protein n=1 Tax=Pseudomonas sp. GOM6 TaxID=3036944 RepID=UPI00240A2162|nr:inovirus Gp2 family protein [Pseudomonas sp. GOM6]MDG1582978.1 inovirus Gp2 family protein [Pseudomonas sp. GOM6]